MVPYGEQPVQAPVKFDLVINLRAARVLGVEAQRSPGASLSGFMATALPAARALAVKRAPRSPPSFTPRRLAAARAALVRAEIIPASSSATAATAS